MDHPITKMITLSSTGTPIMTRGLYGQVKGDGTWYSRPYERWNGSRWVIPALEDIFWDPHTGKNICRPLGLEVFRPSSINTPPYPIVALTCSDGKDILTPANNGFEVRSSSSWWMLESDAPNMRSTAETNVPTFVGKDIHWLIMDGSCKLTVQLDTVYAQNNTPYQDESLVMFRAAVKKPNTGGDVIENLDSSQTTAMIAALRHITMGLKPGQAILYTIFDRLTNLNIGYIKLNSNGFFTAKASTTDILDNYWDNRFVVTSFTSDTAPIPQSIEQVQNRLLVQNDRRMKRTSEERIDDIIKRMREIGEVEVVDNIDEDGGGSRRYVMSRRGARRTRTDSM